MSQKINFNSVYRHVCKINVIAIFLITVAALAFSSGNGWAAGSMSGTVYEQDKGITGWISSAKVTAFYSDGQVAERTTTDFFGNFDLSYSGIWSHDMYLTIEHDEYVKVHSRKFYSGFPQQALDLVFQMQKHTGRPIRGHVVDRGIRAGQAMDQGISKKQIEDQKVNYVKVTAHYSNGQVVGQDISDNHGGFTIHHSGKWSPDIFFTTELIGYIKGDSRKFNNYLGNKSDVILDIQKEQASIKGTGNKTKAIKVELQAISEGAGNKAKPIKAQLQAISGRVLDQSTGRHVGAVKVTAYDTKHKVVGRATSNSYGNFTIRYSGSLNPRSIYFVTKKNGYVNGDSRKLRDYKPGRNPNVFVRILKKQAATKSAASTMSGQVYDGQSGKPVGAVKVTAYDTKHKVVGRATSNSYGKFSIPFSGTWHPGIYYTTEKNGYETGNSRSFNYYPKSKSNLMLRIRTLQAIKEAARISAEKQASIKQASVLNNPAIKAALKAAKQAATKHTIYGRISDNDGKPVSNAIVKAYDSDTGNDDYMGSSKTDAKGNYKIGYGKKEGKKQWDGGATSAKRPDIYVKVTVDGRSFGNSSKRNNWEMKKNLRLDKKIPGVRYIEGNVIDRAGKPVPNVIVMAFDADMENPLGKIFNVMSFIAKFYPPLWATSLATAAADTAGMVGKVSDVKMHSMILDSQKKALDNTIRAIEKIIGDSKSDDFMGTTQTDSRGNFKIAYRGGHWDKALNKTAWRPDIYVRIFKTVNNKLINIGNSPKANDHKLRTRLVFKGLRANY